MDKQINLKEYTEKELQDFLVELGYPAFRGKQVFQWIHGKLVRNVEEMNNLPKKLMDELRPYIYSIEQEQCFASKKDGTKKYLFRLQDGNIIESVWMEYNHGNSVCISSQVGCRMGCRFCASTLDGLVRNLTAGEMLDQVYAMQYYSGKRISNIVVMGTGEPLDNYEELIKFIRLVTLEQGLNISQRNITVSSCGLVPRIRQLAEEGLQITFALSLHATTDEERKTLMPVAHAYSIQEVLEACRYYFNVTKRRVTFEYSLVKGVNDSEAAARRLAKLLEGNKPCHVNLIPVNPIKEREYQQATSDSIYKFQQILKAHQISATLRRSVGGDIEAACGQLRRNYVKNELDRN